MFCQCFSPFVEEQMLFILLFKLNTLIHLCIIYIIQMLASTAEIIIANYWFEHLNLAYKQCVPCNPVCRLISFEGAGIQLILLVFLNDNDNVVFLVHGMCNALKSWIVPYHTIGTCGRQVSWSMLRRNYSSSFRALGCLWSTISLRKSLLFWESLGRHEQYCYGDRKRSGSQLLRKRCCRLCWYIS